MYTCMYISNVYIYISTYYIGKYDVYIYMIYVTSFGYLHIHVLYIDIYTHKSGIYIGLSEHRLSKITVKIARHSYLAVAK